MRREDYIWVAIRVFGIYLLILGVTAIPPLVSSAFGAWMFRDWISLVAEGSRPEPIADLKSQIFATQVTALILSAVKTVLFFSAGWYLLRRGGLVFSLVSKQDPLSPQSEPLDGSRGRA